MAHAFEHQVATPDRENLAVRGWEVGSPRATLIICPGFADHAGRFARLGVDLAARGYSTYAYDARGHGKSSGHRGHTPSWGTLVADLDHVLKELDAKGRLSARQGLLGASMGALVALDWMLSHPGRMHALALIAPFFEAAFKPPAWRVQLAQIAGRIFPTL